MDLQPFCLTVTDSLQAISGLQNFINTQQIELGSESLRYRNCVLHLPPSMQRELYRSQNPTNWKRVFVYRRALGN